MVNRSIFNVIHHHHVSFLLAQLRVFSLVDVSFVAAVRAFVAVVAAAAAAVVVVEVACAAVAAAAAVADDSSAAVAAAVYLVVPPFYSQ